MSTFEEVEGAELGKFLKEEKKLTLIGTVDKLLHFVTTGDDDELHDYFMTRPVTSVGALIIATRWLCLWYAGGLKFCSELHEIYVDMKVKMDTANYIA